jgi:hypothetical protein
VFALSAKLRNPYDEGCEIAAALMRENRLLNFERPPKTEPSSWRNEHHDTDSIRIAIERGPQGLAPGCNVLKMCG